MTRVVGPLLIVLGAIGALLPFVGPLFGFGMGPDPAWVLTESRIVRHLVPGAAIIVGGILLLPRWRATQVLGGMLAVLGGIWLTVAPVVLGRVVADSPPALVDVLRPLTYHYGTGVLITALAAFGFGVAIGRRRVEPPVAPPETSGPERQRVAG